MLDASRQSRATGSRTPSGAEKPSGSTPAAAVGTATATAPRRSPGWAGQQPAPLRRNHGVPAPLETPLFVHEAAVQQARRRRLLFLLAGLSVVLAVVAGVSARSFVSGF